jgi:hypothetical protein
MIPTGISLKDLRSSVAAIDVVAMIYRLSRNLIS